MNVLEAEVKISGFLRFTVRLIRFSSGFQHGGPDLEKNQELDACNVAFRMGKR